MAMLECVSLPQKEPAEFGGLTTYPTLKSSVQFHFRLLMFIPHLLPSVHSPCLPNNTIMSTFNLLPSLGPRPKPTPVRIAFSIRFSARYTASDTRAGLKVWE